MKTSLLALVAGLVLVAGQSVSNADSKYSFSFVVSQKHDAGTKKETYYETSKNQKWSYFIKLENKSFKDVSNIEIKYVMFSKQEEAYVISSTGDPLQRHTGTISIKQIKNNDTVEFSTDAVELTNISYNDGYYVDEGIKGALRGLWLRVYVGGQMVAEYINPPGLSGKERFEGPAPAPKK